MAFSLRLKIILITVAILAFTIGATALVSSYVFSQEYANVLQSRTLVIGQSIESQLNKLLELGIPLEELVGFEKQLKNTVNTYDDIAYAMVVGPDGKILFHNDPTQHNKFLTDTTTIEAVNSGENVMRVYSDQTGEFYEVFIPVFDRNDTLSGAVRLGYPAELITQKTTRLAVLSGMVALVSLGVAIALLIFTLSHWVTKPLTKLLTAIQEIRSGESGLAARVEIDSRDELGELSSAFNGMTAQLHNLVDTLEEQVAERTRQLEAVMEITQRLTVILDLSELLHQVVTLTKETFNYYHVQIYLLDKDTKLLRLAEGYGQIGLEMKSQRHSIALDSEQSLAAQAAREGKVNTVADVQADPHWLPNPLLPDTRSEMAVPVKLGNEVVGVLDLQSRKLGRLTQDDEVAMRSLANQVAVALKNARLFEETVSAREDAEQAREKAEEARTEAEQAKEQAEAANNAMEVQIWHTTGQAQLNDRMRGEQDITVLADNIVRQLCHYLQVQIGALYIAEHDTLKLAGTFAHNGTTPANGFKFGQGLVGQAAVEKQPMVITNVPDDYITISSGWGETVPRNLMLFPFVYEDRVAGVLELGTLTEFSQNQLEFIQTALANIGIAFNTAQARARINELLEETQRQAEELQSQSEELRVANEELETQTASLRESEAKLKEKKIELEGTNTQLEEKAAALEKSSAALQEKQAVLDKQNKDLKVAQYALEQQAEELARASKYKSEFLANMSHELRTPLNSLLILARMFMDNDAGNLSEDQVESAQIIYSGGQDLLNLINDILDLSKVESGKMTFTFEDMPLSDLTTMAQTQFTHVAEEKGLDLNLTLADDLPASINTDPQRVKQIIKNLLSNAFKFTTAGSVSLDIFQPDSGVDLSRSELDPAQTIAISVTDTGIGMTPEQQKIVFEAFQQADGSTSRQYGGTGLGLSISRELAVKLGGEIRVESEPEKGSTFTLYLPVIINEGEMESDQDGEAGNANGTGPAERQPEFNDVKKDTKTQPVSGSAVSEPTTPVPEANALLDDRDDLDTDDRILLVIEDDPKFAKIVYDISHKKDFKCLIAGNGKTGLQLANSHAPKAIILDLHLPDMSGWEVLEILKNDPATRHIPVHIMSVDEEALDAYRKGAMGYLTKPVSREKLDESFQNIEHFVSKEIKTLLLVEDDTNARRSVKKLLGGSDVQISEAGQGQEALDLLQAHQFDCMILDLSLPDMSGFDVLSKMNGNGSVPRCPVIVYTGRDLTPEENQELMKYADSVIVKGVKSPERLLDETALFLHQVVAEMPQDKQQTIKHLYNTDDLLKGKKVLIVDDDIRNSFALSKLLSDKGIVVNIAQNGQIALDMLETESVDLVLMDIMMPVMDGYETTRCIRTQPELSGLPILALTAKAMKGDREKCIEAGANDYLPKPIDVDRLFSMLRVWLYQ